MGTEVTSFFEGAAPSIRLGVAAANKEEEADRDFTLTPTEEVGDTETIPEEGTAGSAEMVYTETIHVWETLPLVHVLPELKEFYLSVIVNQLIDLGIVPLATELARRSLPLGGRLQHFNDCIQTDNSAEEVLQLETRPRGRSSGCYQSELGQPTGEV